MSEIRDINSNSHAIKNKANREFICGVVEGFYGRPWTFSQRKDLFKRLKTMNLNSFMYAPKDDTKHRAKWRDLYDDKEADELRTLISEAESNGIDFYYSLAPGLDMTYSSKSDLSLLRQKFDQIRSLGCKSFAILFDDIEPRLLNEVDRDQFNDNYASAQVSVSNMIYEYLNRPKFLLCPTEYCESRAVPDVANSKYLKTIGLDLDPEIDFMWSGSRVISRYITEESIDQLSKVIQRPPVIWENLHANDYDKKRIYLGPYSGRSTKIIPKLRGVLTNPNCEYEANYIAIHTLAQWSRCTKDASPLNRCNQDTQLLTAVRLNAGPVENEQSNWISKDTEFDEIYDPDRALVKAIRDWLPYVLSVTLPPEGENFSNCDMRNSQMAETQLAKEINCEAQSTTGQVGEDDAHCLIVVDMPVDSAEPSGGNSTNSGLSGGSSSNDMDTSSINSPASGVNEQHHQQQQQQQDHYQATNTSMQITDSNSCDSCEMIDESETTHEHASLSKDCKVQSKVDCIVCLADRLNGDVDNEDKSVKKNEQNTEIDNNNGHARPKVDIDSLALLADFFYLPFEHGLRGHALLSDIKWLIDNCGLPQSSEQADAASESTGIEHSDNNSDENINVTEQIYPQSEEKHQSLADLWLERADRMDKLCLCIDGILSSLINDCPNKQIIIELYPYLAELREVMSITTDYIRYLRQRRTSEPDSALTSPSRKQKLEHEDQATYDEQEPWVHRGGLIGDMQRLIS